MGPLVTYLPLFIFDRQSQLAAQARSHLVGKIRSNQVDQLAECSVSRVQPGSASEVVSLDQGGLRVLFLFPSFHHDIARTDSFAIMVKRSSSAKKQPASRKKAKVAVKEVPIEERLRGRYNMDDDSFNCIICISVCNGRTRDQQPVLLPCKCTKKPIICLKCWSDWYDKDNTCPVCQTKIGANKLRQVGGIDGLIDKEFARFIVKSLREHCNTSDVGA